MKENTEKVGYILAGGIIIAAITYYAAFRQTITVGTDYYFHSNWATIISFHHIETFFETYKRYYPIWHFGVFILYRFGCSVGSASAIAAVILNSLTYGSVVMYYMRSPWFRTRTAAIAATILLLVQPIWLGIDYAITIGHFSPNEWRNPTTLAVRGVGCMAFFVLLKILENSTELSKKYFIFLTVLNTLTVLAKPSFLQMFIPGIGLYMIIELVRHKNAFGLFTKYLKISATFIPAVAIMFLQYLLMFDESGITISWLEFWSRFTKNIWVSMLAAFAFPIYVLVIDFKRLKNLTSIKLVSAIQIVAWLEGAILVETGETRTDGDFVWANSLAMFLVYIVAIKEFIYYAQHSQESKKKIKTLIGIILLIAHFVSGIWWIFRFF